MRLRIRKWGCALGITLLIAIIAVPVTFALLFRQPEKPPLSAVEILRALPIYPGAQETAFTSTDRPSWGSPGDTEATAFYRITDRPQAVIDFYADHLSRSGWQPGNQHSSDKVSFLRGNTHTQLILDGQPPWIRLQDTSIQHHVFVMAYPLDPNSGGGTEVRVGTVTDVSVSVR